MPKYLGKDVTDEFLQGLIAAYREGQTAAGKPSDANDGPIIATLEAHKVVQQRGTSAYELGRSDEPEG